MAISRPLELYEKSLRERAQAFVRDMGLTLVNSRELPYLFTGNAGDLPRRSEFAPESYENAREVLDAMVEVVTPRVYPLRRQPYSRGAVASEGMAHPYPGEMWLFVNGVATSPAVIKANGKELARIFQRPIHLVHNPTDSLLLDLTECIFGRTFNFKTALSEYVLDIVKRALVGYSRVVVIGHSQGGIVVADVANALVRSLPDRQLLKNLEIYTFASAADEMIVDADLTSFEGRCVPYYEHFANGRDFVARFGVIGCKERIAGPLFLNRHRTGHLLNAHYLPGFENGVYCASNSRLFDNIGGGRPDHYFETRTEQNSAVMYRYPVIGDWQSAAQHRPVSGRKVQIQVQ